MVKGGLNAGPVASETHERRRKRYTCGAQAVQRLTTSASAGRGRSSGVAVAVPM